MTIFAVVSELAAILHVVLAHAALRGNSVVTEPAFIPVAAVAVILVGFAYHGGLFVIPYSEILHFRLYVVVNHILRFVTTAGVTSSTAAGRVTTRWWVLSGVTSSIFAGGAAKRVGRHLFAAARGGVGATRELASFVPKGLRRPKVFI
jgi:hypothetical protein